MVSLFLVDWKIVPKAISDQNVKTVNEGNGLSLRWEKGEKGAEINFHFPHSLPLVHAYVTFKFFAVF